MASASLSSRKSAASQCLESTLDEYFTDDELSQVTELIWDCGVINVYQLVQFVALTKQYGNPAAAATEAFEPENVAGCVNDLIGLYTQ